MGYYTSYYLETKPYNETAEAVHEEEFRTASTHKYQADPDKWYDWESDMVEFSRRFPDTLFLLHGDGDERDDIWTAGFLNGKAIVNYGEVILPKLVTREDFKE